MTPIVDENEFLAEMEPSPGFQEAVLERVAQLDALRAALEAEEKRHSGWLVVALVLVGAVVGAVAAGVLVPPLLALRVTWDTAVVWFGDMTAGSWAPVALAALAAGGAVWLGFGYADGVWRRRNSRA